MQRDFEIYENEGGEIRQFFLDAAVIVERIGGGFVIGGIRSEVAPEQYETVGVRAHWESFMPAVAPSPDEESAETPEPVEG